MADHAHSTGAPNRALLPFVFRPSPLVNDPRSADELLEEIAREIDRQAGVPKTGETETVLKSEETSCAVRVAERSSELSGSMMGVVSRNDTPEPLLPEADLAQVRHLRRQLETAAEHGVALLAALDLPRLVMPDFVPLDRVEIGAALDRAIATLDALDGDTDLEDGADDELSLGWEKPGSQFILTEGAYSSDREHDTADAEPSLASPERHPEVPVCFFGAPYTARGGSGGQLRWAEGARDDREMVDEDGPIDEDEFDGAGEVDAEPSIGWPEDFTAEVAPTLEASADAEHDDCDLEPDDDVTNSGLRLWVFGPSRTEVAHV